MMDVPKPLGRLHGLYRQRLAVFGGALVLLGLGAVGWSLNGRAPAVDAASLWIGQVERGELVREVNAAGSLLALELRAVTNRAEGVVESIKVRAGDQIKAGEVLIEMSSPQLSNDLAALRWQLTEAEAAERLARVEVENQQHELRAQHAAAESEYTAARIELDAREKLRGAQVFSEIETERSRLRLSQLNSRLEAETARLGRYPEYREATLAASGARLSNLRAKLSLLETQARELAVSASVDGVVQEINVQEGERLLVGQAVARIVNPQQLVARLRVAERDAALVRKGQAVALGVGRDSFEGRVMRVDPSVRERAVNVDVEIAGDSRPEGLRPELSVTGRIELERLDDRLLLPRPVGFREENSELELFRLSKSGEHAERVTVQVGGASGRMVEIRDGLALGDKVVLSDLGGLSENLQLRLR